MNKRSWAIIGPAALALVAIGALASLAAPPRALAAGGAFQISETGQIASSQSSGTDSQGKRVVAVSLDLITMPGHYPAVMLQLDVTEHLVTDGSGTLAGTATLSDESGQTPIFSANVAGRILTTGVTRYQLAQAHAATGSGGSLTWQGALSASSQGDLTGIGRGALQFPSGLASSLVAAIWPAVSAQYAQSASIADPTLWYVTRGAATSAYVLLIVTTVLGMGISTQAFDSVTQRWRVLDLHQVLTVLMLGLVALHLVTLALDPFLRFNVGNLFWPLGEPYRAVPVALGVIGFYALAIVTLSSWVRQQLSYGVWRALHYVSVVALVALTLHGMLAGTDSPTVWMTALYVTGSLAVIALAALRGAQSLTRVRRSPRVKPQSF